jgi:hypothetical protein
MSCLIVGRPLDLKITRFLSVLQTFCRTGSIFVRSDLTTAARCTLIKCSLSMSQRHADQERGPIYARSAKTSLCAICGVRRRKDSARSHIEPRSAIRSFLFIDNTLIASARAALNVEVIGSPHQWEFAGMAGSRWSPRSWGRFDIGRTKAATRRRMSALRSTASNRRLIDMA